MALPKSMNLFLQDLDHYLKENYKDITCNQMYEIREEFLQNIEEYQGNCRGFSGISEYLIFRFLYHQLDTSFRPEDGEFVSPQLRISHKSPVSLKKRTKRPDISLHYRGSLIGVVQVNTSSGYKRTYKQLKDFQRIHNEDKKVEILLILYNELTHRGRTLPLLKKFSKKRWFHFFSLEGNNSLLWKKLQHSLSLRRIFRFS